MELKTALHNYFIPAAVLTILVTLIVFSASVIGINYRLWRATKSQVIERDGKMLAVITNMGQEAVDTYDTPTWLRFQKFLDSNQPNTVLASIIAVQVTDKLGKAVKSLPRNFIQAPLQNNDMAMLKRWKTISRFYDTVWLDAMFDDMLLSPSDSAVPLLEVIVPIRSSTSGDFHSAIQYWIDGRSMAKEIAILKDRLVTQTALVLLSGNLLIAAILFWSFSRVYRVNKHLRTQTIRLKRANEELILAAKTSAIGAITAHLVHGLKNPIAGLQAFIEDQWSHLPSNEPDAQSEWLAAKEATRRMINMIQDIVTVIHEESRSDKERLTMNEICDFTVYKTRTQAETKNIKLFSNVKSGSSLPIFESNLVMLILSNLVENAIDASSDGDSVKISVNEENQQLVFAVKDHGTGLPDYVREKLFTPCKSNKNEGTGIGLTISQQLSRNIGGKLELAYSGDAGTCFNLSLPI